MIKEGDIVKLAQCKYNCCLGHFNKTLYGRHAEVIRVNSISIPVTIDLWYLKKDGRHKHHQGSIFGVHVESVVIVHKFEDIVETSKEGKERRTQHALSSLPISEGMAAEKKKSCCTTPKGP
eukprot:GHVR01024258.1.p1 GENE.GHVR01024258.1~~GHVR01024258.1.p1  ORF type:complete len:128 (+),score=19.46 GHVR01024258.1:22-384(+)